MIGNAFVVAVFAGASLAVPFVLYAGRLRNRRAVFGIGLTVAAAIYVAFAIAGGTPREMLTEVGGVALFGVIAVLGIRRSPYFLALGWAAHVSWDLLLHPVGQSSYAPWWYPVVCIGFDLVVAGTVLESARLKPGATPAV